MAIPNPVTTSVLAMLTYVLALALTAPDSTIRVAIFVLMLCYVPLSFEPPSTPFKHPLYALFGGVVFKFLLSYADRILIEKWSSVTRGPTSPRGGQPPVRVSCNGENTKKEPGVRATQQSSVAERLWWAAANAFDCRLVSTPWEIVNVPAFSRHDPNWVPKRGEFLRKNAAVCVMCVLLLDAFILLPTDPERNAVMFADQRVAFLTRLGDVSAEEIIVRFISTGLYYVGTFFLLQGGYSGTAVVMVGLGISEVERWPPLFGWYLDAWSLRQFWGFVPPPNIAEPRL